MDSHDVRRRWAERSGEFSPAYYAYYGPDVRSEAVRRVLDRFLDPDAAILELGCSSGRHLAHLREAGYADLAGVEVNGEAFDVMRDAYPGVAADATLHHGAIEDVVDGFADDRFDAVYSVETLQHVHPDAAWVFDELARITGDLLVTVENEEGDVGADDAGGDEDEGTTGDDARAGEAGESVTDDGAGAGEDGESAAGDDAALDHDTPVRDVTYVDDGVPLYHRDWNRVFAGVGSGLSEVGSERVDRDTLRVFRTPHNR